MSLCIDVLLTEIQVSDYLAAVLEGNVLLKAKIVITILHNYAWDIGLRLHVCTVFRLL